MEKHFKLTDESIVLPSGVRLYRIECTKKIKWADVGDKGGFVEKGDNLSDDAWVSGNAQVSGDARVFGNAQVSDDAWVSDDARVYGDAWVSGDAWVFEDARVSGNARVSGDARVFGNARVYGNAWVSGNAWVYGNARVFGDAWVFGDACVSDNNTHCGFDCFGSANRHTHAYLTGDGSVEITCGCFRGSIGEFERKVKETHAGTVFERQYMAVLALIKLKFGLE